MSTAPGQKRGSPARRRAAGAGTPGGAAVRRPARGSGKGRTEADWRRRELSQNYLRSPEAARQFLIDQRTQAIGFVMGEKPGIDQKQTIERAARTGDTAAAEGLDPRVQSEPER